MGVLDRIRLYRKLHDCNDVLIYPDTGRIRHTYDRSRDGPFSGTTVCYYPNGQLKYIENYVDNEYTGLEIRWQETGGLELLCYHEIGKLQPFYPMRDLIGGNEYDENFLEKYEKDNVG